MSLLVLITLGSTSKSTYQYINFTGAVMVRPWVREPYVMDCASFVRKSRYVTNVKYDVTLSEY